MKAKDLRGRNIEDVDDASGEPKQEDDAVAAAYENISKKLESIRSGKSVDDEEESEKPEPREADEEVELEEWKGPKPPVLKHDEPEEEEHELKKVNLRNLEDSEEPKAKKEEDEEKIDPLDDEGEEEDDKGEKEEREAPVKKEWEPKEGDPLDDESEEPESKEADEAEDADEDEEEQKDVTPAHKASRDEEEVNEDKDEERESLHSEIRRPEVSEPSDMPEDGDRGRAGEEEPDTLDDLAAESPFSQKNESRPERREEELPYNRDPEEQDYSIPSLRGSRQEGSNMGYNSREARIASSALNANPKGESVGQSYSPKGSYMEGNDPNNFFSQHQPQAPKRANKFHLLVLIIIGIAVIGFTVYILKGGFGGINLGTAQPSPSPSATATPEPTPTPTPEPEINRGDFTIRVLNGTSTSGLAKTVSDKLKETGYKTAAPGNASDNDVEQTEIRVKEGSQSATLFERLKLDLAPDYDAKEGEKLDKDSKNDAEVIVGAK